MVLSIDNLKLNNTTFFFFFEIILQFLNLFNIYLKMLVLEFLWSTIHAWFVAYFS
jgi:hypothetical protein